MIASAYGSQLEVSCRCKVNIPIKGFNISRWMHDKCYIPIITKISDITSCPFCYTIFSLSFSLSRQYQFHFLLVRGLDWWGCQRLVAIGFR